MAKVTIRLTDDGDGSIKVRIESRPSFPGPAAADQTLTTAQTWGLSFLDWLKKQSDQGDGADVPVVRGGGSPDAT